MKYNNYSDIQKEVKIWFGIDLYDSINRISSDEASDNNLKKIVNYYNENTEESLQNLRRCIHEIKVRLLEHQYNCRINGDHGYNNLKIIKDYNLNQLAKALNFSVWLKQELFNAGVGNFYDICWCIGENKPSNNNTTNSDIIDTLELSVRSHNALKRAGINTIDDLRKLTMNELKNIRNLGQKCFEEIVIKLADRGFLLSDDHDVNFNKFESANKNIKRVKLNEQSYNEIIKRFNALGINLNLQI